MKARENAREKAIEDAIEVALHILRSVPLIDVRAEGEYLQGAVPNSINLPILNDAERAEVGLTYKQTGAHAATELGHRLVSGAVKQARIAAWQSYLTQEPGAQITCWRGGQRSQIAQQWLANEGMQVERVQGGYKALRQAALTLLSAAAADVAPATPKNWWVLAGKTGTAKTLLLNELENSIDLEGLANHRGSAFGARTTPQPSLATFENALAHAYLNHTKTVLVLEDESRTIGRIAVPETWHLRMKASPIALVDADLATRVKHIEQEYVVQALKEHSPAVLLDKYLDALKRIRNRLGGVRYKTLSALLSEAFADQREHADWISYLLENYYDPMYEYQLTSKEPRIAFRGSYDEVSSYLSSLPD